MNNNLNSNDNNNQVGSTPTPDFNTIFGLPKEPESEPIEPSQPTKIVQPVQAPATLEPNLEPDQDIQSITTEPSNQPLPDNHSNIISYQNNNIDDNTLLRAFIGNNYEKITTKPFNIAAFFFTALYMFYRKMFLYGLILIFANIILLAVFKLSIISLIICVLVGLFMNNIYISFAINKITNIKASHPNSTGEELRALCTKQGGTSIVTVIIGIFTEIIVYIIAIIVLALIGFNNPLKEFAYRSNWNINFEKDKQNKEENVVEDITIDNYICYESDCTFTIVDQNNQSTEYTSKSIDTDYIRLIAHYEEYLKINIYYTEKNITSIKVYTKDNSEDISDIKDEESLRKKLGLYTLGTYTDTLTLTSIGNLGTGIKDDYSYTYISYNFTDSKNNEYEMKYINPPSTLNLKEGQSYKVTFEVVEGTFEYEYNIKTIQ